MFREVNKKKLCQTFFFRFVASMKDNNEKRLELGGLGVGSASMFHYAPVVPAFECIFGHERFICIMCMKICCRKIFH